MGSDRFTAGDCFARAGDREAAGAGPAPRAPDRAPHYRHEFPPLAALDAPPPLAPPPPPPGSQTGTGGPAERGGDAPAVAPPTYGEAELTAAVAAAKRDGFAEGEAAGRTEAEARLGAERERTLARLAELLAAQGAAMDEVLERRTVAAAELALAAARAVVPAALARLPLGDVEAMVRDCAGALRDQPVLELALPPSLAEPGEELLRRAAEAAGFRGALTVTADPTLGIGDARLHWRDGWAERDVARLAAEAEALVRRRLSTTATGGGPASGDDPEGGGSDEP